jgi:hypothetical protein
MMSQKIGKMENSTIIEVTNMIVGGIVVCVVVVALFTNFFDRN